MTPTRSALLVLSLAIAVTGAAAFAQPAPDTRAAVFARERAFAASMRDRDPRAFERFLSAEAVFFGEDGPIRGRAAIVAAWKGFFDGPTAPFSWDPDVVEVLASGDLALSSGPIRGPDGTRIGTFNSVWRRESDGVWRIAFDKGCPPCPRP